MKILLVDDHGMVRIGIRSLLLRSSPEAEIDEASSFETAVRKLEVSDYDLSLIDLDLSSDKSGIDLLAKMRELGRGLPAIVLSGHDDRPTVMKCLEVGASGFIAKSSEDESVLRAAIDTVMAGRVYLPSSALGKGGAGQPFSLNHRGTLISELGLRPSHQQALIYVYQGLSNREIGRKMNISEFTARDYCSELYRFFKVATRAQLVVELARRGIALPAKDAPQMAA